MKRFWTYCFFFGISLLIHLFLFLDFFQLPSSPTLRSWEEKIFSKARQFLQVQTSPTNSLPTTPDPKASASLVSSAIPHSIKDSASSELEHAFEEELTPSSKKLSSQPLAPLSTPLIPLENTPPSSSSESEREQPPSQEIPKDIPLAVEKKKSVGVEEALLSQEAEEKNLKVQTPQEYQAFLKEWMANFSLKKEEKIPPLRLLSSLSLEEFYLRQQQGYETFCFPESLRPEYFIEIRIPSPSQILYEKHSDKPHLFARIQNFCLKEEMPLFQRFKAEIGSRPDLYHPRDGLLLIVNIPPASLQSYFQFKQYLALQAFQLRFSDVRLFVGTLKKTTFGQEVLLINGILTQEGKKLYPQDPERTLLQFP